MREVLIHALRERLIDVEQSVHRIAIERPGLLVLTELRNVVTALAEVLIAGGALLTIPALFIGNRNCRQNRKFLNSQGDMR